MRLLALLASATTVAGQTATNYVTNGDFSADTIPDSSDEFRSMNDPAPSGWMKGSDSGDGFSYVQLVRNGFGATDPTDPTRGKVVTKKCNTHTDRQTDRHIHRVGDRSWWKSEISFTRT